MPIAPADTPIMMTVVISTGRRPPVARLRCHTAEYRGVHDHVQLPRRTVDPARVASTILPATPTNLADHGPELDSRTDDLQAALAAQRGGGSGARISV
jgi:hypothetical protein